jgi:hypothetical protein
MNLIPNMNLKTACVLGLSVLGLLLGGCSGDDDNGKGGGFGITYPAVPTDRPTFTGLSAVIDTHGGDGSGSNNGGRAGDINLRALHGRVLHGDNRARPAVNANVLTTLELADNIVTYAELLALANTQVITAGTATIIDLYGQDFFLPSGATLDISGAPAGVDTIGIRANLNGDVIRLDGNVNGVRLTLDSVELRLLSEQTTGTAICVDGNINLSGYPSSVLYNGGQFMAVSFSGATVVRGTINTSGNSPTAANGGRGGDVIIGSDEGDVVVPFGILLATGGAGGATAGSGGDGGDLEIWGSDTETMNCDWAVRNFGGGSVTQGGGGGDIDVNYDGPLNIFCIFESYSGTASSGSAAFGGAVNFQGLTTQGVVQGSVNGGGGGTGSPAGSIIVRGDSVFGLAVEATANGGTGSSGGGGAGGSITVYCDGAALVNILLNAQARGGQGATSGAAGGRIEIGGYGETSGVTATVDVSGGNGTSGNGGNGGNAVIYMDSDYGESITNTTFTATMNGGNGGSQGGNGGNFQRLGNPVFLRGGQRHNFTLNLTGNGGTGGSAAGGNGGTFDLELSDLVSAVIAINASFNGGASTTGTSSATGGNFFAFLNDQSKLTLNGGTVSLRGGANSSSTAGGLGGRVDFQGDFGSVVEVSLLTWNLRGGDSSAGRGGDALNQTFAAFTATNLSQLLLRGGAINATGGQGTAVGGGNGGRVVISMQGYLLMDSPIDTSGGPGGNTTGGSAGPVGIVVNASNCEITDNITANGQTAITAGAAGNISILGNSTTVFTISSTIETRGGSSTSIAGPVGAVGGNIDIGNNIEAHLHLTATAILRSVGGGPNANSGQIDIDLLGTGTAEIVEDAVGLIIALNGAGTPQPANIDRNTN